MAANPEIDEIWEKAVGKVRDDPTLNDQDKQRLDEIQDRETCSTKLKDSLNDFRERRTTKSMQAIQPALDHIESFSNTVSIFVSSHPEVAALVWGSFYLVIQIATRFTKILDTFLEMIDGMMKLKPRLEIYNRMYGRYPRFVKALADLFVEYANFALRTLKILRKHPIKLLVSFFWRSLQVDYDVAKGNFDKSAREVEKEAEVIHQEIGVKSHDLLETINKQMPRLMVKWTMPFHQIQVSQNDRYFARVDVTKVLEGSLLPRKVPKDQDRLHSFSIRGLGGVGKSQVAGNFAWSNRNSYDIIIWLRAENKAVLADDFSAVGDKLLAPEVSDQAKTIDMLRDWLASTDYTWLLIFDNVEERDVLNDFWPKSARGSILLTTRHADIAEVSSKQYWLQTLTLDEGESYLKSLLTTMTPRHLADVREVADELGGLPLALSQAAAYMKSTRSSCSQFLGTYREKRYASDINRKHGDLVHQDYKLRLDTVFSVSVGQLGPDAKMLLSLLAFFDPDSTDERLLEKGAAMDKDLQFLVDRHLRRTVLVELSSLSLVGLQDGPAPDDEHVFVSIHRLLQRDRLYYLDTEPSLRQKQFEQACTIIRQGFPRQELGQPMTQQWPICKKVLPHAVKLHAIFEESAQSLHGSADFAELLSDVGYYLWEMGQLKEAIDQLQTSRKIGEYVLDDCSLVKADVLNCIGAIHIEAGFPQLHEGVKIMDQVLQIRKRRLQAARTDDERRDRTIEVSNALSNLGNAYMGLREWKTADDVTIECITMLEKYANEDDHMYEFAERYANLGRIRAHQGCFAESEDLCRKAVALNGKAHGSDDLRSCLFRFYLAVVLMQADKIQESFTEHSDLLRVRKANLGSTHHDVGDSYYAVGLLQYKMGQHLNAAKMLEQALDVFGHVFWSEDRRARTSYLLSVVYENLQRDEESKKMKKQAEEIRDTIGDCVTLRDHSMEAYDILVFYVHG